MVQKIETVEVEPQKPNRVRKPKLSVVIPQEEKEFEPVIIIKVEKESKPNAWLSFLQDY